MTWPSLSPSCHYVFPNPMPAPPARVCDAQHGRPGSAHPGAGGGGWRRARVPGVPVRVPALALTTTIMIVKLQKASYRFSENFRFLKNASFQSSRTTNENKKRVSSKLQRRSYECVLMCHLK